MSRGKAKGRYHLTLRRTIMREVTTDDPRAVMAKFKDYQVDHVDDLKRPVGQWDGFCEFCGRPLFDDEGNRWAGGELSCFPDCSQEGTLTASTEVLQ